VINVPNLYIVHRNAILMQNVLLQDAAHLVIVVLQMYVMEGKQMEIFAIKTQNVLIISVTLETMIQDIVILQSI
jgi:hypothetical protein